MGWQRMSLELPGLHMPGHVHYCSRLWFSTRLLSGDVSEIRTVRQTPATDGDPVRPVAQAEVD